VYEFATVALLSLFVAQLVDLIGRVRPMSLTARTVLAILVGLGITWAADYSVFAGWGIRFRELWMGPVTTGLVIAGLAAVWHELLAFIGAYAGAHRPRSTEPESHVTRVA
jgi:hypothetical protein